MTDFLYKQGDTVNMDNFFKGINSVGQLFPVLYPYPEDLLPKSAWIDVSDSFRQAGDSLRFAIKEASTNAERESK